MKYRVIYSKRRTLGITVKDGEVIVRSPYGVRPEIIEHFVSDHTEWINKALIKSEARARRRPVAADADVPRLKREARAYFTNETEKYARIMGLKYGRITITSAKTRFGSCNSKGNICFSYRLMLYPEAAREYVIVHELAHLLEMNHSKKFYAIVEKYLPDYKLRRKLLKR